MLEPEKLLKVDFTNPHEHLKYIEAYSYLESLEGFLSGLLSKAEGRTVIDDCTNEVTTLINNGELASFWSELNPTSDPRKNDIRLTLFKIFIHRSNKQLNKYGFRMKV